MKAMSLSVLALALCGSFAFAEGTTAPAANTEAPVAAAPAKKLNHKEAKAACQSEHAKNMKKCIKEKQS